MQSRNCTNIFKIQTIETKSGSRHQIYALVAYMHKTIRMQCYTSNSTANAFHQITAYKTTKLWSWVCEVLESNLTIDRWVFIVTGIVMYSLGHGLCTLTCSAHLLRTVK